MNPQITKLSMMMHDERQRKAELYHKGMKHGEYYSTLKRVQSNLKNVYQAITSLSEKSNRQSAPKSAVVTSDCN